MKRGGGSQLRSGLVNTQGEVSIGAVDQAEAVAGLAAAEHGALEAGVLSGAGGVAVQDKVDGGDAIDGGGGVGNLLADGKFGDVDILVAGRVGRGAVGGVLEARGDGGVLAAGQGGGEAGEQGGGELHVDCGWGIKNM